jgi:predicted RNA-binding protein with RPS1 domain
LTSVDLSNSDGSTEAITEPVENQTANTSSLPEDASPSSDSGASRPRILIGSQRDPAAYRARPKRDWTPIEEAKKAEGDKRKNRRGKGDRKNAESAIGNAAPPKPAPAVAKIVPAVSQPQAPSARPEAESLSSDVPAVAPSVVAPSVMAPISSAPVPLPKAEGTGGLHSEADETFDIEAELNRAMGNASMDELMGGGKSEDQTLEPDSLQSGRVIAVRRDDVFIELPGQAQGILSVRQFDVPPRPGAAIQVVVQRLNPEDGLYELTLPNKAVQVDDWSDLVEGAMIEVRVTGHNTGGLECEVNHIRGFIPVSQVALYRIEDLAPYIDQRLTCVITEANPDRRNLVLSRRAVLEREKEQAREQMFESLKPGQVFDGVVRKLMDFGAFVELGNGVDGLVHISQLAWGRVKHPSDVLKEGQAIKVRVDKIDPTTGKIGLSYRDLLGNPWTEAAQKYPPKSVVPGKVTKLMDFGAFVELEPGVEGLVHVSELSHKRVWRPSDVVKEGDQVEVLVLSIDTEAQRISLSMKACATPPEPVKKEGEEEAGAPAKSSKKHNKPTGPLLGGLGRATGDRFGLKW